MQLAEERIGRIGPYSLVTELAPHRLGRRWLGIRGGDADACMLHAFHAPQRQQHRRLIEAFERLARVRHPHLLGLHEFAFDHRGVAWLVTPYPGGPDGLTSLTTLLAQRGGSLPHAEVLRVVSQLLRTLALAHAAGLRHGPLLPDAVLVDPRGSLVIDLFGLEWCLAGCPAASSQHDEVRSVALLAQSMLIGSNFAGAVAPGRHRDLVLTAWLGLALAEHEGFESADRALEALEGPEPALAPHVVSRADAGRWIDRWLRHGARRLASAVESSPSRAAIPGP